MGAAAGGRGAAAGRARRVGGTLRQQRGTQSRRLPVRHHPEGDPRGVQGLGGQRRSSAASARAAGRRHRRRRHPARLTPRWHVPTWHGSVQPCAIAELSPGDSWNRRLPRSIVEPNRRELSPNSATMCSRALPTGHDVWPLPLSRTEPLKPDVPAFPPDACSPSLAPRKPSYQDFRPGAFAGGHPAQPGVMPRPGPRHAGAIGRLGGSRTALHSSWSRTSPSRRSTTRPCCSW